MSGRFKAGARERNQPVILPFQPRFSILTTTDRRKFTTTARRARRTPNNEHQKQRIAVTAVP
jgi:hypothetical protein